MFDKHKIEAIEWAKIKGQLEALKIITYDSSQGITPRWTRIDANIDDFIKKMNDDIDY